MRVLGELEQDALTEIFNIGVGVAAQGLFQMTGEHVPLSVPVAELTELQSVSGRFTGQDRSMYAIRQTFNGEFSTDAFLLFAQDSSLSLVRMMVGTELADDQLPEVAQDALSELGNIILNAVMSELSTSLGLSLEGTIPIVQEVAASDIFGTAELQNSGEVQVMALMVDFQLGARHVSGYLAFLLDEASTERLIAHLTRYVNGPSA